MTEYKINWWHKKFTRKDWDIWWLHLMTDAKKGFANSTQKWENVCIPWVVSLISFGRREKWKETILLFPKRKYRIKSGSHIQVCLSYLGLTDPVRSTAGYKTLWYTLSYDLITAIRGVGGAAENFRWLEVDDLGPEFGVDQDVCRLEVSMDYRILL